MDDELRERLSASDLRTKLYHKGDMIFEEGSRGTEMYYIDKGKIAVSKRVEGKDHRLAVLSDGETFGEMAVFARSPRSATARSIDETWVSVIDLEDLKYMEQSLKSDFLIFLMNEVCNKLRVADRAIADLVKEGRITQSQAAGFHSNYYYKR